MTGYHIAAVVIDAALAMLAYPYLVSRTLRDTEQELAEPERKTPYVTLCILIGLLSMFAYAYGVTRADKLFLQAIRDSVVMAWVLLVGYIDWKEHIIPNTLILTAMGFWAAMALVEMIVGQRSARTVLLFSAVGFFVVGFVLLVIAVIAKSALGMGDVKLFAVLGLYYGLFGTYAILLVSVITMALVSLVLLLLKKVTVKTKLPMAPFTIVGVLFYILSGS